MNRLGSILLFFFIACNPKIAVHQNYKMARIDSLIQSWHQQGKFHGAILIGDTSQILYQNALGWANRSWHVPVSRETRFDIASLNKSFYSVLIMQLVEQNRLELNKPIGYYLSGFQPAIADRVTIHQLLTHTAGIPDYDAVEETLKADGYRKFKRIHFSNQDYIQFIDGLAKAGAPGKQFHYSNFAYHILAILLEDIHKQPFKQILQKYICQPCGMQQTLSPANREEIIPFEALGYQFKNDRYVRNPFIDLSLGRRIYSTVTDLYKYAQCLKNEKLVSAKSLEIMTTNHLKKINPQISYGYGWVVFDGSDYQMGNLYISPNYIIHGGSTDGFKAMLTILENNEYIVTHLSNIGDQTDELGLTREIFNILIE
ncbi:MAG: serine hydrolase domain-containing protein [Candidatus Cyclobacteriaceae bacterium M3_2C_046]